MLVFGNWSYYEEASVAFAAITTTTYYARIIGHSLAQNQAYCLTDKQGAEINGIIWVDNNEIDDVYYHNLNGPYASGSSNDSLPRTTARVYTAKSVRSAGSFCFSNGPDNSAPFNAKVFGGFATNAEGGWTSYERHEIIRYLMKLSGV